MTYIKRTLYPKIKEHLSQKEITLIIGPRQAGKTTLIKQLKAELDSQGQKTLFFNLDIEQDFQALESQTRFLFTIKNYVGTQKAYIFIDEFQRKQDGGRFIKGIYDMGLPYKFIITGSGSIDLKAKVHESLAGRKRIFILAPLTFEEFFNFKTNYEVTNRQNTYLKLFPEKMQLLLQEYLTFGGYPRVVLSDTLGQKIEMLQEIYSSYLLKDITALLSVEKTYKFQKLLEVLSILDGKLVNISQLSKDIGISIPTVEKYLWYLENTFIIKSSYPFSRNPLKEITRSNIYYFYDLGMKNLISNNLDMLGSNSSFGFEFQTFVFNELYAKLEGKGLYTLNFWRTKNGAEVDIVLRIGQRIIPIEVKYTEFNKPKYSKAMRSFINKYSPETFYVVNKNFEHIEELNNTKIHFITSKNLEIKIKNIKN